MKDSKTYYYNRELSWLSFNERVLNEATYPKNPLCEKLGFLAIYQSNLDEFFSVRVGSLHDQSLVDKNARENKTNMTAKEQIDAVMNKTAELIEKKNVIYASLLYELKEEGIEIVNMRDLGEADLSFTRDYFDHSIMPLLSPQVIAKKNPFPFLKDKEIYAVVVLEAKKGHRLGIVPCNCERTKRLIALPSDSHKFVLLEEVILHYIPIIFDRYKVNSKSLIRIIRNADIDADERFNEDDDDDFRQLMEKLIKVRRKLCPIKMEYQRLLEDDVTDEICRKINLDKGQTFLSQTPLDFSFFSEIKDMLRDKKDLFFPRRVPSIPQEFAGGSDMMKLIEKKDRLLFYPYNSMRPFLDLLKQAANSPIVDSIKITLYRVARNSQIVETLIEAAENGKEVVVLVELRARFDEENNIEWSRRLEDAGCRIIYGLDHYKVHSKLCLITYHDGDKIKYITQVGTGNYNEITARLYTDYCLMTANEGIGFEASGIFRNLCMEQVVDKTELLLVAPKCLQNKIIDMIDEQIKIHEETGNGYIGIKINSLTDKKIIDKLIEASEKGVKIDMVIRGICCLKAGIKGVTDNIHVYSIVGRYLEHSRIYIFGKGSAMKLYIASADFMTRNTTKRVEVAVPVLDASIRRRIYSHFTTMLHDNINARRLGADGQYTLVKKKANSMVVNAQGF
jgi:polyphosphate kinase